MGSIAEGDRKAKGGGDYRPLGDGASWTTVHTNTLGLEGLTADAKGNLYSPARAGGADCPIVRVPASGGAAVTVGHDPGAVQPGGAGVRQARRPVRRRRARHPPPAAERLEPAGRDRVRHRRARRQRRRLRRARRALGVRRRSRVKAASGGSGQRRRARGDVPRAADGQRRSRRRRRVGRDPRSAPPATVTITPTGRQAANTLGSQHIVANGLAFDRDGSLFIADTARGAIWRAEIGRHGQVRSEVGCDTTFTSNTLCLSNVFVQHPALEGADGIALDREGNVVTAVNERNAVVVATQRSGVVELFRNPVSSARPAQRGPARVPDEPGDRGQDAVPRALGRVAARQLPRTPAARSGRAGRTRRSSPASTTGCPSRGCRCRCASRSPWAGRAAPRARARARPAPRAVRPVDSGGRSSSPNQPTASTSWSGSPCGSPVSSQRKNSLKMWCACGGKLWRVAVVDGDQLDRAHGDAGLLAELALDRALGGSPMSAQPPGSVQPPSATSRTSRTLPSRTSAPRTSTFGVGWPAPWRVEPRALPGHLGGQPRDLLVALRRRGGPWRTRGPSPRPPAAAEPSRSRAPFPLP